MNEFYKDYMILDMKPNGLVHRYAVNGKISGNLGAIGEIADAMTILVSPIGCGFHYRYSIRARHRLNDIDCVKLMDQDVIFGSEKKLVELIKKLDAEYQPKVIFILPSVVTDVINDDLTAIADNLQDEVGAKLIVIRSQTFSHMDKSNFTKVLKDSAKQEGNAKTSTDVLYKGCGYVEVMDALVEQLMEPQDVDPYSVNIECFLWGYGGAEKLMGMEKLLNRMGISVNVYLPMGSIENMKKAPRAKLNIVRRKKWAVTMQKRFGTDFFHIGMPYEWHGLEDICEFYREIGKKLGLESKVEKVLQEELSKYSLRNSNLKENNSKYKAGLIINGISSVSDALKAYYRDFGCNVAKICVIMNNNFAAEMGIDDSIMQRLYDKAEEAKELVGCKAKIHFNPSHEEMMKIFDDCDYLICGKNPRYASFGKPILPTYMDHTVFDFEGYMKMFEDISKKIANPVNVGSKLLLSSLDFDNVFFPMEKDDCDSKFSRDVYSDMWRMRKK